MAPSALLLSYVRGVYEIYLLAVKRLKTYGELHKI